MTGTKQFIWCSDKFRENQSCEERDVSGALTKKYFDFGCTFGATGYFYSRDHLGSIRELSNTSGSIEAEYRYDSYGRISRILENVASDFAYAGYYAHSRSNLDLTHFRAYDSRLGRWLSRDPMGEISGSNLYQYVGNFPTASIDPSGLVAPAAAAAGVAAGSAAGSGATGAAAGLAGIGPVGWTIIGGIIVITTIIIIVNIPHPPVIHPDPKTNKDLGTCYHSCRKQALEMYLKGGRQNAAEINKALRKCYDECEDQWGGPDGGTPCPILLPEPEPKPQPKPKAA